ncbi:hypothetical protein [Ponticaulis koreensis]|uniref:hypothetical protein n=1 Tax=Ponticaulis koreensis TaxID=1123045 RepID=UPI0003B6B88A|nr:hypothetical protein [Ponticaulis koreensis]
MDIFTDENTGANKDRAELARKSIAEAGGPIMGAAAQDQEKRKSDFKKEIERRFMDNMTALQTMMQDPEYRALYERVSGKLDEVQSNLDQAILENAEELEQLEDGAAHSKDGSTIYAASDGSFVYADGTKVPAAEMPDPSDIPNGATSWEEYRRARDRAIELARIQGEVIDPARTRIQDPDNPPSKTDLEEIETELEQADQEISNVGAAPKVTHNYERTDPSSELASLNNSNSRPSF